MKRITYTLAALLLVASLAPAQSSSAFKSEADRVAVIAKVKPTVVAIFARAGKAAARASSSATTVMP